MTEYDGPWPPPDLEERMHDLLADIRAAGTAVTNANSGFGANFMLSATAYSRGAIAAIFVAAQIAALRLDQLRQARGLVEMPFPREELATRLQVRPPGRRPDSAADAITFLEEFTGTVFPEVGPIQEFNTKHGLLAFQSLIRVGNAIGEMLVEADPRFESLSDLLAKEALADETEWENRPDGSG